MLATQISYWTMMESKRHNLATEDLGNRTLEETVRHNVQTEDLGWANLAETSRHNKATEGETVRHNQRQELQAWYNYLLDESATRAKIRNDTMLANAQVKLSKIQGEVARQQADTQEYSAKQNAEIGWKNANTQATKVQLEYANKLRELAVQAQNAQTNYWNARTNAQAVEYNYEVNRYNAETNRAKQISEAQIGWTNAQSNLSNARTNQAKLGLTHEANVMGFTSSILGSTMSTVSGITNAAARAFK